MKKFIFLALLIGLVPLNAQTIPQEKMKKSVVYEMTTLTTEENHNRRGLSIGQ